MSQIDEPNWTVPLAASLNTRGIEGYTAAITNSKDQIKINSVYDVVTNVGTGQSRIYLRKRPGFTGSTFSGGSAAFIPRLALETPHSSNATGVILDDGTNIKYYYDATNSTIRSNAASPIYADTTVISGTNTAVVQFFNGEAYFSTTSASWTQITDGDFTGLTHKGKMEFMDGFAFQMDSANKIYNSDLNSISAWTATSFTTKQILQDEPMGLARLGRVLLAFGKETVEGFYNAGNTVGSPLGRIPQLSTRIGLEKRLFASSDSRHYSAQVGNVLYFVGTEAKANVTNSAAVSVFAFDGSAFRKVSTNAVDKILYEGGSNDGIYHVCAFPIASYGVCLAVLLTSQSVNPQRWLVYDPRITEWFLWSSASTQPVNDSSSFIGIGGVTGGKTFQYSPTAWQDDGAAFTMTHQFKIPQTGSHRRRMPMFGVVGDTQSGTSNLGVEFSDDDYATFSTVRNIDLTKEKKNLYRCGSFRGRAVRLTHSDNTDCRLELAVARIE